VLLLLLLLLRALDLGRARRLHAMVRGGSARMRSYRVEKVSSRA